MTLCAEYIFFARSLPHHSLGGMEVVAWDLARAIAQRGAQVEVLTTDLPHSPGSFIDDGVVVTPLKGTRSGVYSKQWWQRSREAVVSRNRAKARGVISVSAAG